VPADAVALAMKVSSMRTLAHELEKRGYDWVLEVA